MKDIKFVKDVWFDTELLTSATRQNKAQPLFMRQGDLDAACAVYSLMMMLLIHKKVNRDQLENRYAAQRATEGGYNSYMRLQDQFLGGLIGLYKQGYMLSDLSDELLSCFKKEATSTVVQAIDKQGKTERSNSKDKKVLIQHTIDTLDAGYPVELGMSYKGGGGHAVVAIGYTFYKTDLRLFCLDPAFELPATGFWNSIVDVAYKAPSSAIYSDLYKMANGDMCAVALDEVLTIDR